MVKAEFGPKSIKDVNLNSGLSSITSTDLPHKKFAQSGFTGGPDEYFQRWRIPGIEETIKHGGGIKNWQWIRCIASVLDGPFASLRYFMTRRVREANIKDITNKRKDKTNEYVSFFYFS